MPSSWLRIDGVPATEIAAHTAPEYETQADGGCTSASFAFALTRRSQHHALRRGALVEIMRGPLPIWSGLLSEPDRTTWECHAEGISASLNDYLALELATGAVTRNLGQAIEYAQSIGCKMVAPDLLVGGFDATGDLPGSPETLAELLGDYAVQVGKRWGVNGQRVLYLRADPIAPTLMAAPGTALFGQTSEATPSRLAGRYFNGTTYETAFAGNEAPEQEVGDELIDRGVLTEAEAESILAGMLKRKAGGGWTNGVTLHRDQLTTMGGQAANLGAIAAGASLRAQGLAYGDAPSGLRLDVVIGRTRYTVGTDSIYLEPVNASPIASGLRGVIAAA